MQNYLCVTCGTQYPASSEPPSACPICQDDRQYVNLAGQQWTTLAALQADHHNSLREVEPGLTGIVTQPEFAIGQRALLVQTPGGNVLWDCISLVDEATVAAVSRLGGVRAMAISHPHFYSSMVAGSQAFGGIPIYLHGGDRQWVQRPDPAINFWTGATFDLGDGLTLVHCGGHFPGSTVLHWAAGAAGKGVVLSGDTIAVSADRRSVSFMYSFPNRIPLSAPAVEQIVASVAPFQFESIHGAWFDGDVWTGARQAVEFSAERYIRAISV